MAANKCCVLRQAWILVLILLVWIVASGVAHGQILYKYIDKDGTFVITDNPPPGFKLVPDSPSDVMEEQISELEQEKEDIQTTREARETGTGRQEKIRAARSEWEQAQVQAENYRFNIQQATNYNERLYWREMFDKQKKVVEESKKKLDELMN